MDRGVITALVAAAGLSVTSCGGSIASPSSGGPSVSLDRFGNEFAAAYCQKMFRCCSADELMSIVEADDEASCKSEMVAYFGARLTVTPAQIDAGLVTYHGDRARACLDKLAALSCQEWVGDDRLIRFAECRNIIEGTLATGSACATNEECSTGHCGTSTGVPICTARGQLGESCDFAECVSGLACTTDASLTTWTCEPILADGAACLDSRSCASSFCIADGNGLAFCGLPPFCDGI